MNKEYSNYTGSNESDSEYSDSMKYSSTPHVSKALLEECPESVQNYIAYLVQKNEQLNKELIITKNKLNTMKYTQENQIEQLKRQLSDKTKILSQYMHDDEVKGNAIANNPDRTASYMLDMGGRPSSLPSRGFSIPFRSGDFNGFSETSKQYDYRKNDIPRTLLCKNVTDRCAATQFAMGIDE